MDQQLFKTLIAASFFIACGSAGPQDRGGQTQSVETPVEEQTSQKSQNAQSTQQNNSSTPTTNSSNSDDDPPPFDPSNPLMTISDPSVKEGSDGSNSTMVFNVALNIATTKTVTVNYKTLDVTAIAGSDYISKAGSLTFAPGEVKKPVEITVIADNTIESNEPFYLQLSGATNVNLMKAKGLGTIIDDDTPIVPKISITNPRLAEPDTGTAQIGFDLTLNTKVLDKTVTVTLTTLDGSAKAGVDYVAKSGVISFAPGELTKTFYVTVIGDTLVEGNESIYVTLSAANVDLAVSSAVGIILDND